MRRIITALLFVFTTLPFFAQKGEYRHHMVEGNLLLLEENYMRALQEFLKAYAIDSTNANINFKVGFCYLKHPTEKHMAEQYLEKAVKDVTKSYDEEDPMMKSAPPMAYLYLGQAFHLDYKFEDALKMYDTYESFLNPKRFKEEIELVEHYKKMSNTAQEKVGTPFNVEITNMGDSINSEAPELSPIISADERMLIFTYSGKRTTGAEDGYKTPDDGYFEDIFVSFKKDDGTWSTPRSISPNVNTVGHDGAVALSADGQTLIIYKDESGDGNLFYSTWDGADWTTPRKFGPEINSPHWEPSACLSPDGNTLYFVSNRPGGFGGRDIYRCRKIGDKWSQAQNLGPKINTKWDEESPWLHPNGYDFFFSSQGHGSMGGFDVMFTIIDSLGGFGEVTSMPYPINTTDDDDFYVMSTDGKRAYYSSGHEDRSGFGEQDIYMITLSHIIDEDDKVALFLGKFQVEKGDSLPSGLAVVVKNKNTGEQVGIYRPQRNGNFTAILKPKNTYVFSYQLNGKEFYMEEINVEDIVTYEKIEREIPLKPVKVGPDLTGEPGIVLNVQVYDNPKDKNPVPNATIELTDKSGKVTTLTADAGGRLVKYELARDNSYKLKASSDNKASEIVKISTAVKGNTTFDKTLFLGKGSKTIEPVTGGSIVLDITVMNKKTYKPVEGAKITVTDDAGVTFDLVSDANGKSEGTSLEAGKVYSISASFGEVPGKAVTLSTKGVKGNKKFSKTIYVTTEAPETYNVYSPVSGSFTHYFEYNKTEAEQNPNYTQFLADLESAIAKNGQVTIKINSSASQVPTKAPGGNAGLARQRGENMKKMLSDYLTSKGVDLSKVKIQVSSRVGGPTYNSDYLINKRTYEKYQFVDVKLK